MIGTFQSVDLARFLAETPYKIMHQAQTPVFLIQLGAVIGTGLVAYWLSRAVRRLLPRFAANNLPRSWAPGFVRCAEYVIMPLIWLAMLWASALAGEGLNLPLSIVGAVIDLVLAWIFIRLLSFAVRSPAMSAVISVVAWTVAALNIVDLYRPLMNWLGRVPVYDGKQTHISLLGVLNAIAVLAVLLWLTRLLVGFLQRRIEQATALTPSLQVLLNQLLMIVLPAVAVMIGLQTVGVDLTTLTVAFGAVGIGVGLGLQKLVSNLVSGLSLIIGKSIKPGDILKYKDTYGWVTSMGARYVTLRTIAGIEHLVPNDYFIENGVENWSYTDAMLCLKIAVGISYDADPHLAMAVCQEAARSVKRVVSSPEPYVVIAAFGDSAINLEVFFWIDDPRNGTDNVRGDVLLAIWDRFKTAGIAIPFPRRDVHVMSLPPQP